MKLFKKKYERSKWMKGLLMCEQLIKDGYKLNSVLDEPLWFKKVHECGATSCTTVGYTIDGLKDGCIDYYNHYQEFLNKK